MTRRPSPALVVAILALVVALGGTGYAALKLPKNSVGAKQIKKNAVTSTKVRNGSLLRKDFKAGQIRGAGGTYSIPKSRNVNVVTKPAVGVYCISLGGGINPATVEAVVTLDYSDSQSTSPGGGTNSDQAWAEIRSTRGDCPTTSQLEVRTFRQAFNAGALVDNQAADSGFFFVVP